MDGKDRTPDARLNAVVLCSFAYQSAVESNLPLYFALLPPALRSIIDFYNTSLASAPCQEILSRPSLYRRFRSVDGAELIACVRQSPADIICQVFRFNAAAGRVELIASVPGDRFFLVCTFTYFFSFPALMLIFSISIFDLHFPSITCVDRL